MKKFKITSVVLALVIVFSVIVLSSCGESENSSYGESESKPERKTTIIIGTEPTKPKEKNEKLDLSKSKDYMVYLGYERPDGVNANTIYYYCDSYTKVMYMIADRNIYGRTGTTITPIYKADGTLLTYDEWYEATK